LDGVDFFNEFITVEELQEFLEGGLASDSWEEDCLSWLRVVD
jgi:hypothetical protein